MGKRLSFALEDGGHVAALEFAGLPPHCRDQIRRWLDSFDETTSPESAPSQPEASKHASLTELRTRIRAPKPPSSEPPAAETASPSQPQEFTAPYPGAAASPSHADGRKRATARVERPAALHPSKVENTVPWRKSATPPASEPTPYRLRRSWRKLRRRLQRQQRRRFQRLLLRHLRNTLNHRHRRRDGVCRSRYPRLCKRLHHRLRPGNPADVWRSRKPAPLPPLLKLSSVRPGPLPAEIPAEPVVPVEIPKVVAEPPARISTSLPEIGAPAATEKPFAEPVPVPPVVPRRVRRLRSSLSLPSKVKPIRKLPAGWIASRSGEPSASCCF